ncbi:hypothetical protein AB835_05155 [Candidatus Endobugula sertula]|uniref:NAD-dependent epimerase/dehydratase domain-containing protein n=1 Tax=Candidatus Endobugula sertula TaxID=62101 RepID=A0A1D2QRG8_9GAMM|nr:hypothetical protein AB835_05155 [Candidatus Endobugula sertula]
MLQEKVLLLGYGDIARRLARLLVGYQITGVRRTSPYIPTLDTEVAIRFADCRKLEQMQAIMSEGFDIIVMTFTPTVRNDVGYREAYVDTMCTVLDVLKQQPYRPRLVVFVSSSSVYAQMDASWVDEDSVTAPTHYSGLRLLEAEQRLQNSGLDYCCVRFSGIYGPGRERLIQQVIVGDHSPAEPIIYSNRIHVDDCVGVLAHLIQQHKTQAIDSLYLATDCLPVPIHEVKQWLARQLTLPDNANPTSRSSRGSKRCSNKRLLGTDYQFLYPSYREGYTELLKRRKNL